MKMEQILKRLKMNVNYKFNEDQIELIRDVLFYYLDTQLNVKKSREINAREQRKILYECIDRIDEELEDER